MIRRILRLCFEAGLLFFAYRETGPVTVVILSMVILRFHAEELFHDELMKWIRAVGRRLRGETAPSGSKGKT
jgi:hypothetical protein